MTVLVFARFSRTRLQCISALLILIVLIANANNCNDYMLIGWAMTAMRSSSARVRRTRRTTRSRRLRRSPPPEQQQQVRPRMQQMHEHPRWSLRFVEQSLGTERLSRKEIIQYLRDFASLDFLRSGNCSAPAAACGDRATVTKVRVACILFSHSPQLHTT